MLTLIVIAVVSMVFVVWMERNQDAVTMRKVLFALSLTLVIMGLLFIPLMQAEHIGLVDHFNPPDPIQLAAGVDDPKPLYCNVEFMPYVLKAWHETGEGRNGKGLAEAGFLVGVLNNRIAFSPINYSVFNEIEMRYNPVLTTAIVHTHGNSAKFTPSELDTRALVPNYVYSRDGLWYTNPFNHKIYKADFSKCQ